MNTKSNNRLNMIRTTVKVLIAHQSDFSAIPAYTPLMEELQAKLTQLEQLSVEQQSITTGVRANKLQEIEVAADKAETIANALRVLAATNHNATLSEQLSFTRNELRRSATNKVIQLFTTIRDAAQSNADALQDYGITAAQIDELTGICEELPEILGSTRAAIVERRERTESHADVLGETTDLLQLRMDRLVELIRATHPETYKQYQGARTIVDLKGKSVKPKGLGDANGNGPNIPPPSAGNNTDHPIP